MSSNSIGSFLAALRKASGMTQKQLAEKLNVSDKAISRWERDECAPDLALIPVLAEIYGVTSDEILRGKRADPDAAPTPQAEEKSKKRLQFLLNQTHTNYRIRSIISVLVAVVGLIVSMILNLGFTRAYVGFLLGCIFFAGAVVCQIIFTIQCKASLQNDDFDADAVADIKHFVLRTAQWTYSIICVLFSLTLPLMSVGNAYWGLPFYGWVTLCVAIAPITAVLCLIVCRIINVRKGVAQKINWKSPINKLRLRFSGILILSLIVTVLLHWFCAFYLSENAYLYSEAIRFDDWDSFKEYMEQPRTEWGETLFYQEESTDGNGLSICIYTDELGREYHYYLDEISETVKASDGTVLCSYLRFNGEAVHVMYSDGSDERLPVYVQERNQYYEASSRFNLLMAAWIPVYLAEIIVVFIFYRKKKAAQTA